MTRPPYIEQAAGLWTEASYLVDTSFDYRRLWREKHGDFNGPRAYMTSIAPTIVARLMKANDDPRFAFVAYRLLTLGLGALTLVCVYQIVVETIGAPAALLTSLVVATWPLFGVQLEILGIEIAMLAPVMLGILCAVNDRYAAATALGLLAATVKVTGVSFNLALVAFGLWQLLVVRRERGRWAALFVANTAIVLAVVAGSSLSGQARPLAGMAQYDRELAWNSCPYLIVLSGVLLAACVVGAAWRLLASARNRGHESAGVRKRSDGHDRRLTAIELSWLMIVVNLGLIALHPFEARYFTIVVPFCALILALGLFRGPLLRLVGWGVMCGALALCLANRNGALLRELPDREARQWGTLERSFEYRADQVKLQELVEFVERQSLPVLATGIFINYLHLPRLGYVRQGFKLPGSYYHFDGVDDNIRALLLYRPATVLVVLDGHFASLPFPGYGPPAPKPYQLIYDDKGRPPHVVYRQRFDTGQPPHLYTRQYFDALFWNLERPDVFGCMLTLGWGDLAAECLPPELVDIRNLSRVNEALELLLGQYRRRVEYVLQRHPESVEVRNMLRLTQARIDEVAARPDHRFATRLRPLTAQERYPSRPTVQRISFLMPPRKKSRNQLP